MTHSFPTRRYSNLLEGPHLHLAEALAAELRLTAERLLRDHRVRAGAARVDLVVHEVVQLEYVHVPDRDRLRERFTRARSKEHTYTLQSLMLISYAISYWYKKSTTQ